MDRVATYNTKIKARNDSSSFNATLKLSWGIKEIIALAKTAPTNPATTKINITKSYYSIQHPKNYKNNRILQDYKSIITEKLGHI